MAGVVTATKQRCPNTKFVLSGYSQGVQVARKAAAKLSADETAFIDSVVVSPFHISHTPCASHQAGGTNDPITDTTNSYLVIQTMAKPLAKFQPRR